MSEQGKRAIVTGITGQDGAYLTQLLLQKGYAVYGTYRRTSSVNFWRLAELGIADHPNLSLVEYDLTDLSSTIRLLEKAKAQEIYNLAAQSFVGVSFEQPITTAEITGIGALNLLEAIRTVDTSIRFYQASTSEMFGKVQAVPQSETRPSTRAAPMVLPNYLLIGPPSITESLMAFLVPPGCLITNRYGEGVRHAQDRRCDCAHQASVQDSLELRISTPSGTGPRQNMLRACGACCGPRTRHLRGNGSYRRGRSLSALPAPRSACRLNSRARVNRKSGLTGQRARPLYRLTLIFIDRRGRLIGW